MPTTRPELTAGRTTHPGHVVHMTLDHNNDPTESVARCDCGWEHRVVWTHHSYVAQDRAIKEHWAATDG